MSNKKIELFDTTLRDGTQGEGVNLSVEDKIRLAKRFDEFGINIIEGGWPGSNPRDKEFFKKIRIIYMHHMLRKYSVLISFTHLEKNIESQKKLLLEFK